MAEVYDGFVSLLGGMSGGIDPALIPEDSYARGINVSARGGVLHTRPGFRKIADAGSGEFQGAGRWSLNAGDRVAVVASNRLRVYDVDSGDLMFDESAFTSSFRQVFFEQADRYLVVQNGIDTPVVLQEVSGVVTRLSSDVSIPPGYLMRFIHGRLHVVPVAVGDEDGRASFVSGDVLLPDDPANVLKFTETTYWNEGGAHGLPAEMGFIRGLAAMRNAATGTGAGALIVLGRRGVSAFDMSIERQFWKDSALSQVLFFDAGTDSPWSPVSVNNDVAYRGQDGIRFIKYTGSALAGSSLSNVPQSNEVSPFLDYDQSDDLPWVSAAVADNRLLVTSGGRDPAGFWGLISLDFAQVHGMSGAETPSYDGLFTGYGFKQVLSVLRNGMSRPVIVVSKAGNLFLYVLEPTATADESTSGQDVQIKARMETRTMAFKGLDVKILEFAEFWVSKVQPESTITVYYRPAGYPLWARAESRTLSAPSGALPQARRRIRIPLDAPGGPISQVTGEPLNMGHEFQFAIEFTGWLQVDKFRVVARTETEGTPPPCTDVAEAVDGSDFGASLDDFDYSAG